MKSNAKIVVCGIDPGIANMSAWIGSYDPETAKIQTMLLIKCPIGQQNGDKPHKQSVQAASADSIMPIAKSCVKEGVDAVVVETAPQWNVPIRLSAATIYGVLRGNGVDFVKFSSPSTKAKAIEFFADKLKMSGVLKKAPDGIDKKDKKTSAKVRLINKRNAVMIAEELLRYSEDTVGLTAFGSESKKDDMADAIMLGCGIAFGVQKQREKVLRTFRRKKDTTRHLAK